MPRAYHRKFNWDEARKLYAEGWSVGAIADAHGVSWTAVQRVVVPGKHEEHRLAMLAKKRAGKCDRCDGPMNLVSRYNGATLCVSCANLARATSVREGELRCVTCGSWEPDENFPSNRRNKSRRGRHQQCTPCQTAARADYRRRNREAQRAYDRAYKARRRAAA